MTNELSNEEAAAKLLRLAEVSEVPPLAEAQRMGAEALRFVNRIPYQAIGELVDELSNIAIDYGAKERPGNCAEVLSWLMSAAPQPQGDSDDN